MVGSSAPLKVIRNSGDISVAPCRPVFKSPGGFFFFFYSIWDFTLLYHIATTITTFGLVLSTSMCKTDRQRFCLPNSTCIVKIGALQISNDFQLHLLAIMYFFLLRYLCRTIISFNGQLHLVVIMFLFFQKVPHLTTRWS